MPLHNAGCHVATMRYIGLVSYGSSLCDHDAWGGQLRCESDCDIVVTMTLMPCSRHRKHRDGHRSKDTSAVNADGVSTVADAVPADQQQQRNDKDAATGSESSSSESSVSESDRRHRHRRRSSRRYVVYL